MNRKLRNIFSSVLVLGVCSASALAGDEAPPYARKIAILFGISQYESGQSKGKFHNIPGISKDLVTLSDALNGLGFESRIYTDLKTPPAAKVEFRPLLKPGDPQDLPINITHVTRIVANWLQDLEASGDRALLFIYFSGHGGTLGKADRVIALPDSITADSDSFYRIKKLLAKLAESAPSVDKYLVIDACAVQLAGKAEATPVQMDEELPTYLYSSKIGTPSFIDPDINQSVFTYYFVQAINRAKDLNLYATDGTLDSEAIREYLIRTVPHHQRTLRKDDVKTSVSGSVQTPFGSAQKIILSGGVASTLDQTAESTATTNGRLKILVEGYGSK